MRTRHALLALIALAALILTAPAAAARPSVVTPGEIVIGRCDQDLRILRMGMTTLGQRNCGLPLP